MAWNKVRPDPEKEKAILEAAFGDSIIMAANGYHEFYAKELVDLLKSDHGTTAMFARSRADRLAYFKETKSFRFLEVKSCPGKSRRVAVEAWPLMKWRVLSHLGVEARYVVECPDKIIRLAEPMEMNPATIFVPKWCWDDEEITLWRDRVGAGSFDPVPGVIHQETAGGSGDPYVLFDEMDWQGWEICR